MCQFFHGNFIPPSCIPFVWNANEFHIGYHFFELSDEGCHVFELEVDAIPYEKIHENIGLAKGLPGPARLFLFNGRPALNEKEFRAV